MRAATYYVRWGTRLDQVPAMIQAGLKQAELDSTYQLHPTMLPDDVRKVQPNDVNLASWNAHLALADLYLQERQLERARDVIQTGLVNVAVRPIVPPGTAEGTADQDLRQRSWLPRLARLAELEGESQKALAIYQQYLRPLDRTRLSGTPNGRALPREEGEVVPRIKALYLSTGGTEAGWLDWATGASEGAKPVTSFASLEFRGVLPAFEAKDLNGRTWRLADLKGKVTLVDVWATWCGPCRAAHPQIQQLYERLKGRADIQILSLSIDDAVYPAATYMKAMRFGFPVIVSKEVTEMLFPIVGVPAYFIVDAGGRRSSPYSPSTDPDKLMADLERVAARK